MVGLVVAVNALTGCSTEHRGATGKTASPPPPSIKGSTGPGACSSVAGRDEHVRQAGRRVLVHLPACYSVAPSRRYPVIVLIHGSNTDETQWFDVGATRQADALAASGQIAPVIIVLPDLGNRSSQGQADTVIHELVPWIDRHYRTVADAAHRAVGGISRGGGAALRAAAARPDLFGVTGGHSPAIGGDVAAIVRGLHANSGRIWLDVGTDDSLRPFTSGLASALADDQTRVTAREYPGGHDRRYWRVHTAAYLKFYAARWR